MKIEIITLLGVTIFCSLTIKAQERSTWTNWTVLTNIQNLPSQDGHLLTIPKMGLFYADNGMLHALDSVKSHGLKKLRFKDNFPFDQLIVNDSTFLVKSQQFVLKVDDDKTSLVTEFDTDNFDIYSGYDEKYNIVIQEDSATWAWYKCDISNAQMNCVVRTQEPITLVLDMQSAAYCIVNNRIYIVYGDDIQLLTEAEKPIMDMAFTSSGLLICTEQSLFIVDEFMQATVLAKGMFHSLYYDEGILYVLLQNGDIIKTEM